MLARLFTAALLAVTAGSPAIAQTQPTVKDLLGRAQSEADRRAVEDLISKLKSRDGTPKPPERKAEPPPAAVEAKQAPPPATTAPSPPPPAVEAKQTPPPASAPPTVSVPSPPPVAAAPPPPADAPKAGPPSATPAQPPVASAPRDAGPAAPAPPVSRPAIVDTAPGRPAVVDRPPGPKSAPSVTRAPDVAEKMDLPRVDIEVFFDLDSAVISKVSLDRLVVLGKALTDPRLQGSRFVIGGHTDAYGPPFYNDDLSQRRAEAVRQFLIENFKLDPEVLIAKGYGSRGLKIPANPYDQRNRRVQIINWTGAPDGTAQR